MFVMNELEFYYALVFTWCSFTN